MKYYIMYILNEGSRDWSVVGLQNDELATAKRISNATLNAVRKGDGADLRVCSYPFNSYEEAVKVAENEELTSELLFKYCDLNDFDMCIKYKWNGVDFDEIKKQNT